MGKKDVSLNLINNLINKVEYISKEEIKNELINIKNVVSAIDEKNVKTRGGFTRPTVVCCCSVTSHTSTNHRRTIGKNRNRFNR